MRWLFRVWMFCVVAISVTGCVPEDPIYIRVIEISPPVFMLSDSQTFSSPLLVNTIHVYAYESEAIQREFYWSIYAGRREIHNSKVHYIWGPPVAISEVVYGVVPDGFVEFAEDNGMALPLEPNRKYGVEVRGGKTGLTETV